MEPPRRAPRPESRYKGLVAAYLGTRKYKEALCTAKEAVATLPNNAAAIALVGKVLATSPEGTDKAKRAFAKALQLDGACSDAALALADLHEAHGDYPAAVGLLKTSLEALDCDAYHAKLADVRLAASGPRRASSMGLELPRRASRMGFELPRRASRMGFESPRRASRMCFELPRRASTWSFRSTRAPTSSRTPRTTTTRRCP